jgi:flagellar basal-body rod modification protein FlgD
MQVHSFNLPISPIAGTLARSNAAGNSGSTVPATADDTNSMFMKLLQAQLQNQSPLDPVDPMQFTSQLVQFNMLDQLTQINSVLQQGLEASPAATSGGN